MAKLTLEVRTDEIVDTISHLLDNYKESVIESLNKTFENSAKSIVKDIKKTCVRSKRSSPKYVHLADSFKVKKEENVDGNTYIVWSPKKYRIAHLVESGFFHKRGKRMIQGRPFLRPAFEREKPNLEKNIKKIIQEGG